VVMCRMPRCDTLQQSATNTPFFHGSFTAAASTGEPGNVEPVFQSLSSFPWKDLQVGIEGIKAVPVTRFLLS